MRPKWKRFVIITITASFWAVRNMMAVPFSNYAPYNAFLNGLDDKPESINNFSSTESIERSFNYLNSIKSFRRKLQFLHIPKTAGSTMEQLIAAHQANVSWGICRYPHRTVPCKGTKPDWFLNKATPRNKMGGLPWVGFPSMWHTVPHLFRPKDNPYHNFDVFTVTRDPIDRALSEFHFQCFFMKKTAPKHLCEQGPTAYYEYKLQNLSASVAVYKYIVDDSHLVPQREFIMRPLDVRQVDFILSLDRNRIGSQFNQTAQAFQLPMYWPGEKKRAIAVNREKHIAKPLSNVTEKKLRAFYVDDLTMLSN